MINNHYALQRTTGGYAMAEPAIKKAINVLELLNRDVDTKELYEIREKSLKDEVSLINGTKLEAKREAIFELLEDFGVIPQEVKKLVNKEEDFDVLKKWHKLAARANSIDEFANNARLN